MTRQLWLGLGLAAGIAAGVVAVRMSWTPAPTVEVELTEADVAFPIDEFDLEVELDPRPVQPMRPFDLRLRVHAAEGLQVVAPHLSFNMTMDMGPHDYQLIPVGDAWVARDILLPACPSGGRLWFGDLRLTVNGRALSARLRLELQRPDPT